MKKRAFIKIRSLITIVFVSVCIFAGLLFFWPSPNYKKGFENLHELQEFAKTLDEWIKRENQNVLFPSYKNYYSKIGRPNILRSLRDKLIYMFYRLGLPVRPCFSFSYFKNLLAQVTQQREKLHYENDFVNKVVLTPDSKIVVFGTSQGAFHGLIRCLEKLKDLNIIDENLSILDKDYYIVFLGNAVNRSPYTLELLSILMKLVYLNPSNVIYLRGEHEHYEVWKNHTLHDELLVKLAHHKIIDKSIADMKLFFNSLPYAVYCIAPFIKSHELITVKLIPRIENQDVINQLTKMEQSEELLSSQEKVSAIQFKEIKQALNGGDKKLAIRAVVQEIRKRNSYLPMDGLRMLEVSNDRIYWTVYSTAFESARFALKFFYDAFVIINPADELDKWTITLFNRDVRSEDKSFSMRKQLFFTGKSL